MFSAGQSEGQTQGLHLSLQTREFKHEPNELHSAIAGTFNPDQPMFHTESMGIPGHQTNLNVFPENGMKFESPQPHVSHQMGLSGNNSGGMMMPVSTTIGQPMPQPPMGMGGHQNFGQINVMGPQPGVDLQQQQMLNLMRQRAGEHIVPRNGSGSSTPTATLNTTESPRNTSGGGRGGRRKNAASTSSQPGEPPVQG
jgi:hypothetical protein